MSHEETAKRVVSSARAAFQSGRTKSLEFRKKQLLALARFLEAERASLEEALYADLHKCQFDADTTEIDVLRSDIANHLEKIDSWALPKAAGDKGLLFAADTCLQVPEPLGVALIIGAWNFPVQLSLLPLIGAISAGCCAIIKPSEVSANSALALEKLTQYLDPDCYHVVNGGVDTTTALLQQRFDHIFYTGGSSVGKIIMKAAAEHLTPVTLELGGKCPCIVDKDCDIKVAAKRIAFGKFLNAGQVCISPDYVLCDKSVQPQLVDALQSVITERYGEDPKKSSDYGRIINERHFDRIKKLVDPAKVKIGGQMDVSQLYIAPTVMTDVHLNDQIMKEEVFGPILPIVTVDNEANALDIINSTEKALVVHVFSSNSAFVDNFQKNTSSGTLMVNDTLIFHAVPSLPFGGVGQSGTGSYHGYATFKAFSHMKTVMKKSLGLEFLNAIRYPPYSKKKLDWISWLLFKNPKERNPRFPLLTITFVIAALAVLGKALGFF